MYGFTKSRSDEWDHIYTHENFLRGNKNSMRKIQRKGPRHEPDRKAEALIEKESADNRYADELREIKERQIELERMCL